MNKCLGLFLFIILASSKAFAQVGIGTENPDASALLELKSTQEGFLMSRMTASQRNAISTPAKGLMVYQTDSPQGFYYFTGTQWTQLHDLQTILALYGNVDNTSDTDKPISSATQSALDGKENASNKSNNITADATSTSKYPSVKAIKDYVDTHSGSGTSSGTVSDATTSSKGIIQLSGVLSGTATAPTLQSNVISTSMVLDGAITNDKIASGISKSKVGLSNVDNTTDLNKPISSATQSAIDLKENLSNKSTNVTTDASSDSKYPSVKAVKTYVDASVSSSSSSATVSDATISAKGVVQLSGVLSGTATSPDLAAGSVTNAHLAGAIDLSSKVSNTLSVANGGTGATTLTGLVKGNGTSAFSVAVNGTDYTLVREVADEFTATNAQTSFTLSQAPSSASKVKMFLNGVRISNNAYSVSGTTLTYNPTNNGSYSLTAGDRIQFDYFY